MSFSSEVKEELCRIEPREMAELKAECYGVWLFSKCYALRECSYTSENGAVVRKMAELAAAGAGVSAEVKYVLSRRKKPAYSISIAEAEDRRRLLEYFGNTGKETNLRINRANFEDESCYKAFLRGAFLSCGVVIDPNKEYRLELLSHYEVLTNSLYTLLGELELDLMPTVAQRKGASFIYITESTQIENLLTYMGATQQAMELMQVKMYKEVKNNINRRANFETANMDKTYSASAKQTAAIARISDEMGLESLPEELRDLAMMRLENPEMTLREMAERLKISRSGVNHRLSRLLEMGERIAKREQNGE